jgi:hypothetical protein
MRRVFYGVLTAVLVILAVLCLVRLIGKTPSLPAMAQPEAIRGRSCAQSLRHARVLTTSDADGARQTYLWIIANCETDAEVLRTALLEAGSLLGHLMDRPDEARMAYEEFLRRFPNERAAADALFHLAKLEIDAGDSPGAVAHLTLLAQRFPDSAHTESATFLAGRAADLVSAERRRQGTVLGQLARTVPTNALSLLALLAAIGPSVIQTVRQTRKETATQRQWMMPGIIIGLTLLNYIINNIDSARRDTQMMDKLDQLIAAGAPQANSR